MKYLISTQETYRVSTESEVEQLIAEAKEASEYDLAKYTREYKEKKLKGEVVDSWFRVTLTKKFADEKNPEGIEDQYE